MDSPHSSMRPVLGAVLLLLAAPGAWACVMSDPYEGFSGPLSTLEHEVSGTVTINDKCTITVDNFRYDGRAPAAYWWCSASEDSADMRAGFRAAPMRLMRAYDGEDMTIALDPSVDFATNCRVLGVWCESFQADFGHVPIETAPSGAAAPPAKPATPATPAPRAQGPEGLANCKDLIPGKLQLMWSSVMPGSRSVTAMLVGRDLPARAWMSFGFADPAANASVMTGSDVVVAGMLASTGQGFATDYYLTERVQCNYQGAQDEGVCPDAGLAWNTSANNVRLLVASTAGNITAVKFTKDVATNSPWDRVWATGSTPAYAIFAYGPLSDASTIQQPIVLYHGPTAHSPLQFKFSFGTPSTCQQPLMSATVRGFAPPETPLTPVTTLSGVTEFNVTTGDNMNYPNPPGWGLAYHINDNESPVLRLVRGVTYRFNVMGGPTHPLYITTDIIGGASNASEVIYAGGPDSHGTPKEPYLLEWTPPADAPDLLYYQCYVHQKLGWRVELLDEGEVTAANGTATNGSSRAGRALMATVVTLAVGALGAL